MKEVQTDPLTKLYDTWPTDDGFFRKQEMLELAGSSSKVILSLCRMFYSSAPERLAAAKPRVDLVGHRTNTSALPCRSSTFGRLSPTLIHATKTYDYRKSETIPISPGMQS